MASTELTCDHLVIHIINIHSCFYIRTVCHKELKVMTI